MNGMLSGLERATKDSLRNLAELLGDDLTGNGDISMASSKMELAAVIEDYVKNIMEDNDYMFNETKDVSADIGYRE